MKKSSGVFRISEDQELAVRSQCAKHAISRSELFRRVINWAIELNLPIPKQTNTFRFPRANGKGDVQKSSYLFGSKLSSDILLKINYLCKCHGVKESHLYRSFLEGYLMAHSGGVGPSQVKDQPKSKPVKDQNLNLPPLLFSKPTFTYKLPKPDTNTMIGRIQAYNLTGIEKSKQISNLLALGLVLYFCFNKK